MIIIDSAQNIGFCWTIFNKDVTAGKLWRCDRKGRNFHNPNQEIKVRMYQIHDFGIKSLQYKNVEYKKATERRLLQAQEPRGHKKRHRQP